MAEGEWSLAAVHDVLADAVPDREMLICGDVRRIFGEVRDRATELEALLGDVGPRAAIYHRRYGPLLAEVVDPAELVLIDIEGRPQAGPRCSTTKAAADRPSAPSASKSSAAL